MNLHRDHFAFVFVFAANLLVPVARFATDFLLVVILWNWLIPALFGLPSISVVQGMWMLLFLALMRSCNGRTGHA